MSDLGVTSIAFDLVIGDMLPMDKFGRILPREKLGLIVAFQALILGNVTIPFIVADVTLKAAHTPLDVSFVVETYPLDRKFALWLNMA
jgi:hypothetical protein